MTNAERQKKWYQKNKNNQTFIKKREQIEKKFERKIQRVIRELNRGNKSFQNMKTGTIVQYEITLKDAK